MRYVLILLVVAVSCIPDRDPANFSTVGYRPIYASQQQASSISMEGVRPTTQAGKIYAYGNYLFQVEQNEGIHVIDNSVPQNAQKIAFIKVPTCSEIAIRSNFLYTNNVNDLVVIDISNIQSPQVVQRLAGAFPVINQSHPNQSGVYFECPDPSKGVVIGWKEEMITNAQCRR